jgi:hypothetical protein
MPEVMRFPAGAPHETIVRAALKRERLRLPAGGPSLTLMP